MVYLVLILKFNQICQQKQFEEDLMFTEIGMSV